MVWIIYDTLSFHHHQQQQQQKIRAGVNGALEIELHV